MCPVLLRSHSLPMQDLFFEAGTLEVTHVDRAVGLFYNHAVNFFHGLIELLPLFITVSPFLRADPSMPIVMKCAEVSVAGSKVMPLMLPPCSSHGTELEQARHLAASSSLAIRSPKGAPPPFLAALGARLGAPRASESGGPKATTLLPSPVLLLVAVAGVPGARGASGGHPGVGSERHLHRDCRDPLCLGAHSGACSQEEVFLAAIR